MCNPLGSKPWFWLWTWYLADSPLSPLAEKKVNSIKQNVLQPVTVTYYCAKCSCSVPVYTIWIPLCLSHSVTYQFMWDKSVRVQSFSPEGEHRYSASETSNLLLQVSTTLNPYVSEPCTQHVPYWHGTDTLVYHRLQTWPLNYQLTTLHAADTQKSLMWCEHNTVTSPIWSLPLIPSMRAIVSSPRPLLLFAHKRFLNFIQT